MDGSTLIEALHSRSINVRYLGKLTALLASVPLQYLNRIAVIQTDSSMGETHFYLLHAGYGTDGRPIRGCQPFPEVFTVLGTNNTLAAKSGRASKQNCDTSQQTQE
ncbi:unnamed protein product [Lasius platythorax]|uniref:CLU central domain-containing protein n=1 Tax=Lasius platythorax TaxID=488582 RepID=A0AAV2MWF8_9HYME